MSDFLPNPSPGFAPAPVNSVQYNAQAVEAQARKREEDTQVRTGGSGMSGMLGMIPDWIKTPVEAFGSFAHSAYTNVISRPISTFLLATYIGSGESDSMGQSWANLFDGDIWDRAWNDSKHVSPGQALEFGLHTLATGSDIKSEMMKPVQYKPNDIYGRPIIDQNGNRVDVNLNATGFIWDNPDAVQVHFDSGIQKYISGGLDFYSSWYLDPTALAGRGVGMFRQMAYVKPMVETERKSALLARPAQALAAKAGLDKSGQKVTTNVAKNVGSSTFTSMGDLIMKQKEKLGDSFGDWVTHQNWSKNSADSGSLANALSRAGDRKSVDSILAVSMGDRNALAQLTRDNAELGVQMNMLQKRKDGLIANNPVDPATGKHAAQIQLQLEDLSKDMELIDAQRGVLTGRASQFETMKNGMYFNNVLSPIMSNFGQYARGLDTIGKAGGGISTPVRYAAKLAYNNLYVRPVRIISGTTWNGVRAPGHIAIDAEDSHRALTASLQEAKAYSNAEIQELVGRYVNADRATKDYMIAHYDQMTVGRIASKYGLNDSEAAAIYRKVGGLKARARDGRVYSTATITTQDGGKLRADHVADDGSLVVVSPVLNSQLQNTHILTDYEHMDRVLKYNAGAFKKLLREGEIRARAGTQGPISASDMEDILSEAKEGFKTSKRYKALEFADSANDVFSSLWKFNVLLRLGYGPRAIADDFMGQVATLGASNMFYDRLLKGGRGQFVRQFNKTFGDRTGVQQQLASIDLGIEHLTGQIAKHEARIERIQQYLPPGQSYLGRGAKGRKQFNQRTSELRKTQAQLDDATTQRNLLREQRNKVGAASNKLSDNYAIMPDGTAFPLPYEGPTGQMSRDMLSGRRTIDSMMGGTASSMWNEFRNGDWRTITFENSDYVSSYLRVLNQQFKGDAAVEAVLRGENMGKWLATNEGRAYRKSASPSMRNMSVEDHAYRIEQTVEQMLPANTLEGSALRELVANGASESKIAKAVRDVQKVNGPKGFAPDVQAAGIEYNLGKGNLHESIGQVMDKWYDVMNRMPSEALSRNPLFFQLYRQHASDLWNSAKDSGVSKISAREQERIAERARQLAVKDVKKLTFNMDYETKLAHALRFVAPFWGPTQESFTRWGHIIADKPEILGHAANIYTSPIRAGWMVDNDGNHVDQDGYVTNPDGTKRLAKKSEMHIQLQAPQWAAKALGIDGGSVIDIPINTLNLTLQNDPWYNPGTGPWVQIPASWVATHGDPSWGDTMKSLGILQNVTPDISEQLLGSGPKALSQFIFGEDKEQQQRDMAYVMQAEDYKWKTGMRDTEPTWQEVKDKVAHGATLRAWMKATLPVSSSFKDPYQYFRDRYKELVQADQNTADQIFLAKYGDAAFAFTGAMTYNRKGLPSTVEAVLKDQKYAYLTDADPDLAALIVNPTPGEPFSQTAYVQQMMSGDRRQLTAQEVRERGEANAGWAMYDKYMNGIRYQLHQAGMSSFSQNGAKRFDNMRKAVGILLTSPTIGGQDNRFYNEQFAKQFMTIDRTKDDRQAAAMNKIVREGSLVADPMRSDIRSLASYMDYRNALQQTLIEREKAGGSADIRSDSNRDLRYQFSTAAAALVEADTKFESLYNRWLDRDMFDQHNPMG